MKGDAVAQGFVHTVYKNEMWFNELEEGNALPGTFATKEEAVAAGRVEGVTLQVERLVAGGDEGIANQHTHNVS